MYLNLEHKASHEERDPKERKQTLYNRLRKKVVDLTYQGINSL